MSQIGTKVSIGLRIKYRYSCPILMERDFLGQIFEKKTPPQIPNFMKTRPVVAELFHVERQAVRHDEA